jgi:hypothetical protein
MPLEYTQWADSNKTWTVRSIEGHPDADGTDIVKFQYNPGTRLLSIDSIVCHHNGAHGSHWAGVICLGNENAAAGMTTSGKLFLIVCSDRPEGKNELACAIVSDLERFNTAGAAACWTADDG